MRSIAIAFDYGCVMGSLYQNMAVPSSPIVPLAFNYVNAKANRPPTPGYNHAAAIGPTGPPEGMAMSLAGVVMAAGEGRRMRSRLPKPLHRICGREMVRYPVELLKSAGAERVIVVVSPENQDAIRAVLGDVVEYAVQPQRDGTAGALSCCAPLLEGQAERVLVVGGDTPLASAESVARLLEKHATRSASMTLLTAPPEGKTDLGRVIVENGKVSRIVEAAEWIPAFAGMTGIAEVLRDDLQVNAGIYCFEAEWLWRAIKGVQPSPSGERYLTALAAIGAGDRGRGVRRRSC